MEPRMRHCKEKIFKQGKSNGKMNWEKLNKNCMELEELERNGTKPRTGHCRENMSRAGRKCIVGR